jgi:hypothetical protein
MWLIVFNQLYFLPRIENSVVVGLGVVWCVLFGYAYFERRARRRQSAFKPAV